MSLWPRACTPPALACTARTVHSEAPRLNRTPESKHMLAPRLSLGRACRAAAAAAVVAACSVATPDEAGSQAAAAAAAVVLLAGVAPAVAARTTASSRMAGCITARVWHAAHTAVLNLCT
eukprot:119278-Chlamydomonas_euryale.AAC.3